MGATVPQDLFNDIWLQINLEILELKSNKNPQQQSEGDYMTIFRSYEERQSVYISNFIFSEFLSFLIYGDSLF